MNVSANVAPRIPQAQTQRTDVMSLPGCVCSEDRAEINSRALDELNDSSKVRKLAQQLGKYQELLNLNPPGDHHFYRVTVPLDNKFMVIASDWPEDTREGWLSLDSDGIHLIRDADYCMGEECFTHTSSSSVRPWWGERALDKLLHHKDREILASVDLDKVEARIDGASQEASHLGEGKPMDLIKVTSTQRYYFTFDQL